MAGSGGSGGGSVGGSSGGGFSGGSGGFSGGPTGFNNFNNNDNFYHSNHNHNGGRKGGFPFGFIIFIIIVIGSSFLGMIDDNSIFIDTETETYYVSEDYNDEEDFSYETIQKEPLSSDLCDATYDYITDSTTDGYFSEAEEAAVDGFEEFYDLTGIEPHIYLADYEYYRDIALLNQALDCYYNLFDDEGHLLIYFLCDGYDYSYQIIIGDDTADILDDSALSVLNDNIGYYMDIASTDSPEDILDSLNQALSDSANDIMTYEVSVEENSTQEVSSKVDSSEVEVTETDDPLDNFIESEFGNTDDEDDFLNGVFNAVKESGTNSNVFLIVLLVIALILFTVIAITLSKKHNNYEPDTFENSKKSNQNIDDYYCNYDSNSEDFEDDQDYE